MAGLNLTSVSLLLDLLVDGIGVAKNIQELARRVKAGERISDQEVLAAQDAAKKAADRWDAAGKTE